MVRPHPDKMTFLEHLEELRQRLVRAAIYLALGFAACWGFREQIFHFMTQPMRKAGYTEAFIFTSPAEALMLYMKMAFFVGIFVAAPLVLSEIWGFISPGLYKNEKVWAIPFVGMGSTFFVLGALFGHYFLFPNTFRFLSSFGGPDMRFLPQDRRVLVLLLVVPAGPRPRLPDPRDHLRPRPPRARDAGLSRPRAGSSRSWPRSSSPRSSRRAPTW